MTPEKASEVVLRSRDSALRTDVSLRVLFEKDYNAVANQWSYQTVVAAYNQSGMKINHWMSGAQKNMNAAITVLIQFFTSDRAVAFWNKAS